MLALTSKSKYGIVAVLDLAAHYGHGLVQIKDVADRQSVPQNYLVQVMNGLVKAGLVRTVRGKNGGYALTKNPIHISLFELLEALEGPLELKVSASQNRIVGEILAQAEVTLRKTLNIPLSEILQRQQEMSDAFSFQI